MELELEGGHHAEVAATTPQCPEEVRILLLARPHPLCAGEDGGEEEIVDGQSEFARGPAKAATEREASNTGCRVDAKRRGEGECLRFLVEVGERGAGLNAARARCR